MADHKHRWIELGRVFPFDDADHDPALLSPEGMHDPDSGELVRPQEMNAAQRKAFSEKVPVPVPHVILQCAECKDIEHAELTDAEWKRLSEAYESGALDPDGNGTNRLLSQAHLSDLGLERIAKKLDDPRASGARETIAGLA